MSQVHSTSDERTVNNVMRHQYRVLTQEEKDTMLAIKDAGLDFHNLLTSKFGRDPDGKWLSREISIAATKIEEAVMWAVKHVTR